MATCEAVVANEGNLIVLLKFEPKNNHFMGEVSKDLFIFEPDRKYKISIEVVDEP